MAAANLDASSAQQLAHMFTPPDTALVDPLCAGLFEPTHGQALPTTRKRPATCVNEVPPTVYGSLIPVPSVLPYNPQLDSIAYRLGAQPATPANPLVGSSAWFHLLSFIFALILSSISCIWAFLCLSVRVFFIYFLFTLFLLLVAMHIAIS